jgi:hypothetical protein
MVFPSGRREARSKTLILGLAAIPKVYSLIGAFALASRRFVAVESPCFPTFCQE